MSVRRMSAVAVAVAVALAAALLVLLAPLARAIDAAPPFEDPARQARYVALIHELRCLKCQGENIADTPALFAQDIRRQVREMVAAGKTDHEIIEYFVDRYGEIILLKPRWSAKNAWLWLAPGVFVLLGGVVVWRIVRGRQAMLALDHEEVT